MQCFELQLMVYIFTFSFLDRLVFVSLIRQTTCRVSLQEIFFPQKYHYASVFQPFLRRLEFA